MSKIKPLSEVEPGSYTTVLPLPDGYDHTLAVGYEQFSKLLEKFHGGLLPDIYDLSSFHEKNGITSACAGSRCFRLLIGPKRKLEQVEAVLKEIVHEGA